METEKRTDPVEILDGAITHLWNYREDLHEWYDDEDKVEEYDQKLRRSIEELHWLKHELLEIRRKTFDSLLANVQHGGLQ